MLSLYFIQDLVLEVEVNGKPSTFKVGTLDVTPRAEELIYDIPKSQVLTTSKTCILQSKQQITEDNYLILLEVKDELSKTSKCYVLDTYQWRKTELGSRKYYMLKEFKEGYVGFNKLATQYFEKEDKESEPTQCFCFEGMGDLHV
ncbi:hypothetical protein P9Z55_06400 [Bacillus thuringiensis]|uniref:hypothetical protein n=1 Tax=Bacillus thuringiensis TaxID=1428 RepID=UPI002DB9AA07|nr:hypothetical protein [Bacillus thuringiensis]MEC2801331.1 hypothetical protein [Bacillus thuringiensis]